VGDYPVKSKRLKKRTRYFNYLVLTTEGTKVAIQKRTHKDIWQGLYEFPLFESSQLLKRPSDLKEMEKWKLENPAAIQKRGPYKQTLSHQYIVATFWEIEVQEKPSSSWIWVDRENLSTFAVPKIIHWYLEDKSLYLNL
jgi:A/G-specific adenine glycosylase